MPHGDELPFNPVTTDFSYIRLIGDRKEIEAITQKWDKEVINRQERLVRWAYVILKLIAQHVKVLTYITNHTPQRQHYVWKPS